MWVALAIALGLTVAAPATAATSRPAIADCTSGQSGAYPPGRATIGLSRTVVTAGSTVQVTASGFAQQGQQDAGGTVTLTFCSTPVSVGTATIRPDGTIVMTIRIPSAATPGQHLVQAQGPNGSGGTTTISTGLTVVSPASSTSASTSLPFTGLNLIPVIVTALALLALGAALVGIARQRLASRHIG